MVLLMTLNNFDSPRMKLTPNRELYYKKSALTIYPDFDKNGRYVSADEY